MSLEKRNDTFIGRNANFTLEISSDGWVSKLLSKGVDVSANRCFYLEIDRLLDDEPYINQLSSVVSFEFDTDFGQINRIYTIKERVIVIDDVVISKKETNYHYSCHLSFKPVFDYFMVGHTRFDVREKASLEAKDLLLVNESKNLYLGFVFKERMQLHFTNNQDNLLFELCLDVTLSPMDMCMISYTFSLV